MTSGKTSVPVNRRSAISLMGSAAVGLMAAPAILPRRAFAQGASFTTLKPGVISAAMIGEMPLSGERDGKVIGADVEMLETIASALGMKVEWKLYGWPAVIEAVQSNRAEWFGGNFSWTETRSNVMQLTDAIFYTGAYLVMKQDKPFTDAITIPDLAGYTLGTVVGFSTVPDMRKIPGVTELKLYDNTDAVLRDVVAGRLDFAVLDSPVIDYIILQNPDFGLKQIPLSAHPDFPTLTSKFSAVWGIPPDNHDLFDAVNQGLRWLHATGRSAALLAKYGLNNPNYMVPMASNPRLGIDRDAAGNPIGTFGHTQRDFSAFFTV